MPDGKEVHGETGGIRLKAASSEMKAQSWLVNEPVLGTSLLCRLVQCVVWQAISIGTLFELLGVGYVVSMYIFILALQMNARIHSVMQNLVDLAFCHFGTLLVVIDVVEILGLQFLCRMSSLLASQSSSLVLAWIAVSICLKWTSKKQIVDSGGIVEPFRRVLTHSLLYVCFGLLMPSTSFLISDNMFKYLSILTFFAHCSLSFLVVKLAFQHQVADSLCCELKELPDSADHICLHVKSVAAMSEDNIAEFVRLLNAYGAVVLCPEVDDPLGGYSVLDQLLGDHAPHDRENEHGIVELNPERPTSINVAQPTETHLPHTDDAYTEHPSSFMTLQCRIAATSGGESILVSGATLVKELTADELHVLMKPGMVTMGRRPAVEGSPWKMCSSIPMFWIEEGRLQLRWRCNDGCLKEVSNEAAPAYHRLDAVARSVNNHLVVPLKPTEILVVDNRAHAHGRKSYPANEARIMWRKNYFGNGLLSTQLTNGIGKLQQTVP